jgi:hypothetical protein
MTTRTRDIAFWLFLAAVVAGVVYLYLTGTVPYPHTTINP